jgi:hypothetical protein
VKLRSFVDRLDPSAVHRQQFPAEQVQLAAEQHELAEDRAESLVVDAAEIGDRFEVRLEVTQQPNNFDIPMRLRFQPTARADAVEVAVNVELQKICGRVAWAAGHFGLHTNETRGGEVQPVNEGVDEADGVVLADIFVQQFGQQQCLESVVTGDVRHDPDSNLTRAEPESVSVGIHTVCLIIAVLRELHKERLSRSTDCIWS